MQTNATTEKTLRKPAKLSYNDKQKQGKKQGKKQWQRNNDKRSIIV